MLQIKETREVRLWEGTGGDAGGRRRTEGKKNAALTLRQHFAIKVSVMGCQSDAVLETSILSENGLNVFPVH